MEILRLEKVLRHFLKNVLAFSGMIMLCSCSDSVNTHDKLYSHKIDLRNILGEHDFNELKDSVNLIDSLLNEQNEFSAVWAIYLKQNVDSEVIVSYSRNMSELYFCPAVLHSYLDSLPIVVYSDVQHAVQDSSDIRSIFDSYINDDMIGEKIVIDGEEVGFKGIELKHITLNYEKRAWKFEDGELMEIMDFDLQYSCDFNEDISRYNSYR